MVDFSRRAGLAVLPVRPIVAMTNCTYCDMEIHDDEAAVCPQCGVELVVVPWEHPSIGAWPVRWWRTCLLAMRSPLALFRRLRPAGRRACSL